MTLAASAAAAILVIAIILLSELASGRPMRRVSLAEPMPAAGRRKAIAATPQLAIDAESAVAVAVAPRRLPPAEPTLAPALAGRVEQSLQAIAGAILAKQARRILVTHAERAGEGGRPLGALALARELSHHDGRVVLVDFSPDEANAAAAGEGAGSPTCRQERAACPQAKWPTTGWKRSCRR
jgi:hypothetical protein